MANNISADSTVNSPENENSTRRPTCAELQEIYSFLKRLYEKTSSAFFCHCACDEAEKRLLNNNYFQNISSMECKVCKDTMKVNPYWMFDKYPKVNEEIFRFLRYHNQTKVLCSNVICNGDDTRDILPAKLDRFGNISTMVCIKCATEMPIGMNTANSYRLIVINDANDLQSGDEILFRRYYGVSHHAIYIKTEENTCGNSDIESGGREVRIDVISHTFDKEDARVIQNEEYLNGVDAYRVDYDSCYSLLWAEGNAKRAKEFTDTCKDKAQKMNLKFQKAFESQYDPLMDNCEHFSRHCKTGQSESRQVYWWKMHCCQNIAMLALRVAILAIWWVSEAIIVKIESHRNITLQMDSHGNSKMATLNLVYNKNIKEENMEVLLATSLCALFLTLKVIFTSIRECRHIRQIRRGQESAKNEQNAREKHNVEKCCYICSICCCIHVCCPERCLAFRYFCRMLCCLVPGRLCGEFCCPKNFRVKQCCDYTRLKFCWTQYVAITVRNFISEVIVLGVPIALFDTFELFCPAFRIGFNSLERAGFGVLFTLPLLLFLTCFYNCIANTIGKAITCCCLRSCCCCSFKDSENVRTDEKPLVSNASDA